MSTTYLTENFDGVTAPALPSGWAANLGTIATSAAQSSSSPNSLQLSTGTAGYVTAAKSGATNTLGGDTRTRAKFRKGVATGSFIGWFVTGRTLSIPSGGTQVFPRGYRVSIWVNDGTGILWQRDDGVAADPNQSQRFSGIAFNANFTATDWYEVTLDTVTMLNCKSVFAVLYVKRVADSNYLVPSGSGVAWVASQAPTPLASERWDDVGAARTIEGVGYGLVGAYLSVGNTTFVDDYSYADLPYPVAYSGSAPSDEVEWTLDGTTGISSGVAAGSLANLGDGDVTTSLLTTTAKDSYVGVDLGAGHTGTLSRVLFCPRAGSASGADTSDEMVYLNTVEGVAAGTWEAVGQVPGQSWLGRQLNEVPVDHTPGKLYQKFRVRSPYYATGLAELYFLGNRATGVSWRPARPTITPGAGRYAAGTSVTIATLTSGASIYYTTDGSTPTTASTLYTGALTLPTILSGATYVVKAIAHHASGTTQDSAVVTAEFRPAEFVPSTGTTRFGTSNAWPSDWYDDRGRLIDCHYGEWFRGLDGYYYRLGMPMGYGANEILSTGANVYRSSGLYNWTRVGTLPCMPARFNAVDGYVPAQVIRPRVIVNAGAADPNKSYVVWCSTGTGTAYSGTRAAAVAAGPTPDAIAWLDIARPQVAGSPISVQDLTLCKAPDAKTYMLYNGTDAQDWAAELDPATDFTTFKAGNSTRFSATTKEGFFSFVRGGYLFVVGSDPVAYGANTAANMQYKAATTVAALDALSWASIWASAPGSTSVPYHAQGTSCLAVAGRDGLVLVFDFGDSGEVPYDLSHVRTVVYPAPPSAFPSPGVLSVPTPAAWDLSTLPAVATNALLAGRRRACA